MNIAIDLDKTLFNCNSVIYKVLNKLQFSKKNNKKLIYKTVNKKELSNVGFLKFFSRMFNPDSYTEINNAGNTIRKWFDEGHNIIFLSSRPHNIKAVRNSAVNWLNKNNIPYHLLILGCNNKGRFCKEFKVDVLIDDNLSHCVSAHNNNVSSIHLCNKIETAPAPKNESLLFKADNWNRVDFLVGFIALKQLKAPNARPSDYTTFLDYFLKESDPVKLLNLEKKLNVRDLVKAAVVNEKTENTNFYIKNIADFVNSHNNEKVSTTKKNEHAETSQPNEQIKSK